MLLFLTFLRHERSGSFLFFLFLRCCFVIYIYIKYVCVCVCVCSSIFLSPIKGLLNDFHENIPQNHYNHVVIVYETFNLSLECTDLITCVVLFAFLLLRVCYETSEFFSRTGNKRLPL